MLRNALITLALILLTWGVFGQTTQFDFINYDDPGHVTARPELGQGLSIAGLRWVFTTTFVANYIPVTGVSFLVDESLHGLDPGGYHLTNVILHTLNGLLLYFFLLRTTRAPWPSAAVAALFLIHPLRAESVAWISSRKDLTCGLFWMLTLHAYASHAAKPRARTYAAIALGICFALLSKPMAVTLPCVLLLLDYWPLDRFTRLRGNLGSAVAAVRRLTIEKLPLFLPVIAAGAATVWIQQDAGAVSSVGRFPITSRLANALVSYAMYIANTIFPRDLVPLYPYEAADSARLTAFAALASVLGLIATVGVARASSRRPWLATGWFWYLGTLVPVIGLVQVGAQSMADRYTYLPQIGIWIVIVWSHNELSRKRFALRAISVIILALSTGLYAHAARRQTAHWRDSISLWSYTVDASPNNAIAHSLYGEALLSAGRPITARYHIEKAIELQPGHRAAMLNLANIEVQEGNLDKAAALCTELIARRPDDPDANTTLASILIRRGRPDQALDRLAIALDANPNHADALINRGAALLLLNQPAEALAPLDRALRIAPRDAAAHTNYATALYLLGRLPESRRHCNEALQLDPDYAPALNLRRDLDAAARR